jgi:ribosomal protein S18 acetylase RimI-like enzyme
MGSMHTRRIRNLTIRPLRACDAATVSALFERLSDRSRAQRFGGAKPRLTEQDLELLTRVDEAHHVLVAYVDGDPEPAGIARLVREGDAAEVAFAVADAYQHRGIGSVLVEELACDARAAGIKQLSATVRGDNPAAATLITRSARHVEVRWCGGEREFVAAL